jgi:hypothetical protein
MSYDAVTAAQKARLVQFAYNMYEAAPNSLTPPVDAGLADDGYQLLYYLNARDFQDVKFYGYVAASLAAPGDLVVAIRGTEGFNEWLIDFNALPTHYLGKGFVPEGFRSIAETFQLNDATGTNLGNLATVLEQLNAQNAIRDVTVLGHSLGGALATLAMAQIVFSGTLSTASFSMWTYASPTVAFPDFADAFNKAVPDTYRIWNSLDIVPGLPPLPYVHVGQSEELKQTQGQIEKLVVNPPCEHHLTTYEWLLDPAKFSLDAGCTIQATSAMAAHASVANGAVAVSEAALGAAVLASALQEPVVV